MKVSGQTVPGKASIDFTLTLQESGIIELRQLQKDMLASDDAAWAVLAPPKKMNVLLVTAGNAVIETALRACPIAGLKVCTPAEFGQMEQAALSIQQITMSLFWIVMHLPNPHKGRYLTFGFVPAGIDVNDGGQLDNQVIIDWRSRHPVLNYVNLSNLFAAKCKKLICCRVTAKYLLNFLESPAIAIVRRRGSVYLLVGFDVLESNWPFETSFVLFCYNALTYLSSETPCRPADGACSRVSP